MRIEATDFNCHTGVLWFPPMRRYVHWTATILFILKRLTQRHRSPDELMQVSWVKITHCYSNIHTHKITVFKNRPSNHSLTKNSWKRCSICNVLVGFLFSVTKWAWLSAMCDRGTYWLTLMTLIGKVGSVSGSLANWLACVECDGWHSSFVWTTPSIHCKAAHLHSGSPTPIQR